MSLGALDARASSLAFLGRLSEASDLVRDRATERARWVRAYVAAARGDFGTALAIAGPLSTSARARPARFAASITAGSILRQTGRHRAARAFDERARSIARGPVERAHASIGLAADAIGLGRAALCARHLADAAGETATSDWRVTVRLDWVRTEHALVVGTPVVAVRFAGRAFRRSMAAGARRHAAKSLLFRGVAGEAAGDAGSLDDLHHAAIRAAWIGAAPIEHVARQMLDRSRALRVG